MSNRELPFLTTTPGIGGVLKHKPEDFVVEEVPLYEPSGEGSHVYLWIEKRDLTTPFFVEQLAKTLEININEIGAAGRKDRWAVTRQFVSIPARDFDEDQLLGLDIKGAKVLSCCRHTNRLKTGHLKANRFEIVIRETASDALSIVNDTAAQLEKLGFANWYGEQRFGIADDTDDLGFQLLRGMKKGRLSKTKLKFALSAAQSRMFNDWLAARLDDGLCDQVIDGDVMQFQTTRATFVAQDVQAEQARFEAGEIVPTGPLFGPKMAQPESTARDRETAILNRFELNIDAFSQYRKRTSGTRRRMRIKPKDFQVEAIPDGLLFRFELESGVYATTLLREFLKPTL